MKGIALAAPPLESDAGAPDIDADPAAARAGMIGWLVADARRIRNPRKLVQETCARLAGQAHW